MDKILRALAGDQNVRISLIDGTELVDTARKLHGLSRTATAALGRQLLMTALMTADLKNDTDRISTIIKGNGPAGTMICTGYPNCNVKGMMQVPDAELPLNAKGKLDVGGLVGLRGTLTVLRDLSLREPYSGSSNLISGEIAEDFAEYFAASQQQPSLVYLGVHLRADTGDVRAAGGVLVQPMPGCPDALIDRLDALGGAVAGLAERLSLGESPESFIEGVFSELNPEILSAEEPHYRCDCSRERIERALISLGAEELADLIEKDGKAELTCDFCHARYAFDREELTKLLWAASQKEKHD